MYIFSYGSLRNKQSRELTLPGQRFTEEVFLRGYVRKFNAPVNGYLYLNIVSKNEAEVPGVMFEVTKEEFERLKAREIGYAPVGINSALEPQCREPVYAFIAPDISYPTLKIPRSYIQTCLAGVSELERESWLQYTIIENEIEEDELNPVYENIPIPKHK